MAYHIDNKNLPKCNAAPQTPSLELEMLKNRYENAIKKAEEAKQLFEQKALGLDNNQTLAATNAKLVDEILPAFRGGLQTKEVSPADIEQVITPDDGYLGLQRVKVAPYEREVQVVNRRANESEYLYYMEDIATQYQRSDYAVCMAGEFFKNADTTILAGADAYLTSDGDFYTSQTTHTWHDDDDMHANRWVVYYFKEGENKSNFISDASICPAVLAIKGHIGKISISGSTSPIADIIVSDDSSVAKVEIKGTTPMWQYRVMIKNVLSVGGYVLNNSLTKNLFLPNLTTSNGVIADNCTQLVSIDLPNLTTSNGVIADDCTQLTDVNLPKLTHQNSVMFVDQVPSLKEVNVPKLKVLDMFNSAKSTFSDSLKKIYMPELEYITTRFGAFSYTGWHLQSLILPKLRSTRMQLFFNTQRESSIDYMYVGCKGSRTEGVQIKFYNTYYDDHLQDIEIGDGALQHIRIEHFIGLTRENIVKHILAKLGDNTGQYALTLTLGATNLAKLTDEDKAIATAKNWTLA